MVDIYVGQENTHWTLHEKLLCERSKFFRNIFQGKSSSPDKSASPDKSSKQQSFELPDDEDEPFKLFVAWLYSGSVPHPREEKDLTNLFELYLMSEKWAIADLTRESLETVRNFYKDTDSYPALRRVQYIYANTEKESPMRTLLIGSVARMLVLGEGIPTVWDKALRKNGQLAVDLLLSTQKWGLQKENVPDSRQDSVVPIMEDSAQAKDNKDEGEGEEDEQEEEGEGDNEEENEEEEEQDGEEEEGEQDDDEQ